MSISPVKRFEILVPRDQLDGFLSYLQEIGLAQLDSLPYEEWKLAPAETDLSEYERWLARLNHVITSLPETDPKKGLDKLLAQKPKYSASLRKALLDFNYQKIVEDYEKIEAHRNELLQEIKQIEKEEDFLRPLTVLTIPLRELTGLRTCQVELVQVQPADLSHILEQVRELEAAVEIIKQSKNSVLLMIIYHEAARAEVERIFSELKANFLVLSQYLNRAKAGEKIEDILKELGQKKEERKEQVLKLEKELLGFAVHRPALMAVYDVLLNEKERMAGASLAGLTEKTSLLTGWVPAAHAERFAEKIHKFSDLVFLTLRDPSPEEQEQAPVILENPEILKPFEIITSLYGLPQPGTIDPTVYLAPFFFVFVGLCVSEGGYGLLVALLSLLYLKLAKPQGGTRMFMRLMLYLGLSNVVFGTLVGGWFGYPIKPLLLIDPLKDPIRFMILSLVLGFIQVLLSTFLSLVKEYREGNRVGAIAVKGGWIILLPSLAGYLALKQHWLGYAALLGAAGIVLFTSNSKNPVARVFSGLYGLYGISGYMADILSYSRILALGLSTGVIAMVVNTIVQTVWRIPVLGWIFGGLVFIGGHLFNLSIGFLGAFVHSMRLQFVEFFTRFYQAGGRPFKPFKLENKYVEFIR